MKDHKDIVQVDLSPTIKAAEQLADFLPDKNDMLNSGGEAWHFFHFQTIDFCAMERTIQLACQKQGLAEPCLYSISRFAEELATDPNDVGKSSKKAKAVTWSFENAAQRVAPLRDGNGILFVWQTFEKQADLQYGPLLQEFLRFCDQGRADQFRVTAEGAAQRSGALLGKRLIFIFYGENCPVPPMLRDSMRTITYPSLSTADFSILLSEAWRKNQQALIRVAGAEFAHVDEKEPVFSKETLDWYVNYMAGIPELSVRRLMADFHHDFQGGAVDFENFKVIQPRIVDFKNERLKLRNRLEVIKNVEGSPVKGVQELETWLKDHAKALRSNVFVPTGILLVGIPGTGKSAAAKMAAQFFKLPLVKLDMSKILGGRVGDSEKGMNEMLEDLAYAAPCVLWIDEVEKALSGVEGKGADGGVVQRLFGMLLTFMQENNKAVFTVTTANDISKLPPEFFRNGRFDQAFCMMMPDYRGCCDIMQSKLKGYLKVMYARGIWKKDGSVSEEDLGIYARSVFNACIGTKEDPRFLTGADIEAHVKELFSWYYSHDWDRLPSVAEMANHMKRIAGGTRVQARATSFTAMQSVAASYLKMMQGELTMAGSAQTPFVKENLDLARSRFYRYDPTNGFSAPPADCLVLPPAKQKKYEEDLESGDPADWYDAVFFKHIKHHIRELVIYDHDLTPEETRRCYWEFRSSEKR